MIINYISLFLAHVLGVRTTILGLVKGMAKNAATCKKYLRVGYLTNVNLELALFLTGWQDWFFFALYGAYYAYAEGTLKAFVADLVSGEKFGTACGLLNGVIGLKVLPASLITGFLWQGPDP